MRYRYRFKGRYKDGERILVVEQIGKKINGLQMPKAKEIYDTLKTTKLTRESTTQKDTQNHSDKGRLTIMKTTTKSLKVIPTNKEGGSS